MLAVMLTSRPALLYLTPPSLDLLHAVPEWRAGGLAVAYTVDAGPNVHCICPADAAAEVERRLRAFPGVRQVLRTVPGGEARRLL
jgi:diphosphomevalonate decarboxylase